VWVAQLLGFGAAQQVIVGIATVIGHNWPIFLRFNGGRGMFTTLGITAMLSPKLGLIALVITYIPAPLRQVALGATVALVSLPFFSWFLSQPLDIEARLPITLGFVALALIILSRRLIAPRTLLSESVHPVELFFNRVLFDRDIRDRKAWVRQTRPEVSPMKQPPGQEERKG
jgi:glycerol-3-phosphate acyltransferase PlsY